MFGKIKYLVLVVLFLISACSSQTQAVNVPSWITIENRSQLGESTWTAVIDAATKWNTTYGCNRNIVLRPFQTQSNNLGNGVTETVLEQAGPGYMDISSSGNTYNIALHAMTHACAGDITNLTTQLQFSDGYVTGFTGLTILVTLRDGTTTMFTKIEEGVAERNASCLQPGYSIQDPRYFELGKQARSDFPCGDNQVIKFLETSDMKGLVSYYYNIPVDQVTVDDLINLMSVYNDAWVKGSP